MTKNLLLILSFLLIASATVAQTDTTHPRVVTPDSALRPLSAADSLRHDSIARHRKAMRDSLRRVRRAAQRDSLAAVSARLKDSAATPYTAPAPLHPAAADRAPGAREAPSVESFWQKVLALNPDFNFTGKPVVEIFEIHHPNSKDGFFYLLVGILFYFALIRIFFEKYFNNLLTLFFRVSLRQQQIREQVLQTPLPSLLLNILFIISGGLYACFLLHYYHIGEGTRFWVLYVYCMVVLGGVYLVKFVVLKFLGWVFSISRATDIYIFVVFLVNKMMGIFLLPFLIVITFSDQPTREVFITISLVMIFIMWIYRALASYRPVRNEIKLTPFYFFLYLCAFEIAPVLLIYKVLLTYLEKVY
ncbi:MAG TPA: DUF4271 domain-containing protein [Puia sp.]|nr:DUF4271 domain-containing protein [Puia sp.]